VTAAVSSCPELDAGGPSILALDLIAGQDVAGQDVAGQDVAGQDVFTGRATGSEWMILTHPFSVTLTSGALVG